MASELRVNTLKDANGNNSIATSVVHSGSAKAWASYGGTSQATKDSYNVASITDESTDGVISYTLTSGFDSINYAIAFSSGYGDHWEARNTSGQSSNNDFGGRTSTSFTYSGAMDTSGTRQEVHDHSLSIHGDLA